MQSSADGLVLGHQYLNGLNKKNRKAFQISLQPDWQIDKSIFNSQSCHVLKSGTQVES